MRRAVYAGSFDPLTNGHMWVIGQSLDFDELVIGVGTNPDKRGRYTFSKDERVEMVKRATKHLPNVRVEPMDVQYINNFASSMNGTHIVRGIRNTDDFKQEEVIRDFVSKYNPELSFLYSMPPPELRHTSSSFVKGLIGYNGWEDVVEGYVPRVVYNNLLVKFSGLQGRWSALWERIGGKGTGEEAYRELISLYGETKRAYHNFVHIAHALREMDGAKDIIENPDGVEMAIWYHDAIYNTNEKCSEEKSAELAGQRLGEAGLMTPFIDGVADMILATKHQTMPAKSDKKYLVDIDLSILGKSHAEFDEYERDIRNEYSWVSEAQFRQGRGSILQGFLDRDSIYSTDFFRQKYEEHARRNLERSMAQLSR